VAGRDLPRGAVETTTFASVSGCSGENIAAAQYSALLAGPCCVEWMRY
jgi:hypothetical protein